MAFERYKSNQTNLTMKRSRSVETIPVYYHAYHGDLIPTLVLEGLPGDNWKIDVNDFTRMSTPITCLMGNIRKHHACFYVPKRIIWAHTKQFYGEATTFGIAQKIDMPRYSKAGFDGPGVISGTYANMLNHDLFSRENGSVGKAWLALGYDAFRTFGCFMKVVAHDTTEFYNFTAKTLQPVNILPLWAVMKCYNEHFRDSNFCDPYQWDMTLNGDHSSGNIATRGGVRCSYISMLPKVRKDNDMFVSFLPWAQKGDPVMLPLGTEAPVLLASDQTSMNGTVLALTGAGIDTPTQIGAVKGTFSDPSTWSVDKTTYLGDEKSAVAYADLTNATAVTISQLLYAVAYQDFLQRLCKFGSRYGDYIKAIFGVSTDDSTQDIPEFLGYFSQLLNIDSVVQTTGHTGGSDTELGDVGGYSSTYKVGRIADYGVKEPGYICCFTYFKHERSYGAGIDEMFLKKELLDEYQTPFANISDMPYPQALIFFNGLPASVTTKFGFNEPWLSYRTHSSRVVGYLDPNIPGALEPWTLAEKYDNAPILGATFVEEDRDAIARALTTGISGPDYMCNTNYTIDVVRVMPLYSSGRIGTF